MLLPVMYQHEAAGDLAAAAAAAAAALEIGQRFGDADLFALAAAGQGYMLMKQGRVKEGLGLLDEAMVAVTTGELSPIPTGLVYCGVILACQEVYELGRAREWTAALTRWCADQPDLVAFTGRCLVHRAEIMQLEGAWPDALEEARRAAIASRKRGIPTRVWPSTARESSIACRASSRRPRRPTGRRAGQAGSRSRAWPSCGWHREGRMPPPPRSAARPERSLSRSSVRDCWPPTSEIMLAVDDLDDARNACRELGEIAESYESGMLTRDGRADPGSGRAGRGRGATRAGLASLGVAAVA